MNYCNNRVCEASSRQHAKPASELIRELLTLQDYKTKSRLLHSLSLYALPRQCVPVPCRFHPPALLHHGLPMPPVTTCPNPDRSLTGPRHPFPPATTRLHLLTLQFHAATPSHHLFVLLLPRTMMSKQSGPSHHRAALHLPSGWQDHGRQRNPTWLLLTMTINQQCRHPGHGFAWRHVPRARAPMTQHQRKSHKRVQHQLSRMLLYLSVPLNKHSRSHGIFDCFSVRFHHLRPLRFSDCNAVAAPIIAQQLCFRFRLSRWWCARFVRVIEV